MCAVDRIGKLQQVYADVRTMDEEACIDCHMCTECLPCTNSGMA